MAPIGEVVTHPQLYWHFKCDCIAYILALLLLAAPALYRRTDTKKRTRRRPNENSNKTGTARTKKVHFWPEVEY